MQDALANLMRNRTTFVIAHRLSTVRRADFISRSRAGAEEIGAHEELCARTDGVYAKLYALQAFDKRDRGQTPRNSEEVSIVIRSMTGFAAVAARPRRARQRDRQVGEPSLSRPGDEGAAGARRMEARLRGLVQQRLTRGRS